MHVADPPLCSDLPVEAGFENPVVRKLPLASDLDTPHTVLELAASSPRMSLPMAQQSAADRRWIEEAIVEGALRFRQGERIRLPIPGLLTVARKPA